MLLYIFKYFCCNDYINIYFNSNQGDITPELLSKAGVFVLPGPREKFTVTEVCYTCVLFLL